MGIPIDTLGYSRLEQPKTEGGYGKQELFPLQVPIWDRAKHLIQCGAKQGRRQALSVVLTSCCSRQISHLQRRQKIFSLSVALRISTGARPLCGPRLLFASSSSLRVRRS